MVAEELKPCPFCNGEAQVSPEAFGSYRVYCKLCEAGTGYDKDKDVAIFGWNMRVGSAEIETLRDTLRVAGIDKEHSVEMFLEMEAKRGDLIAAAMPFATAKTRAEYEGAPDKKRHWHCWVSADEIEALRLALNLRP